MNHQEIKKILLNGEWVIPQSQKQRKIINPSNLDHLGTIADCNAADVDQAVKAAKQAQNSWWRTPGTEKANILRDVAQRIRAISAEVAHTLCLETGKPLVEAIDCIEWSAAAFDYYGEVARSSFGNSIPPGAPHQINFTIKEPYGVVAAIAPFNFPILLMAWKVAPALAAGNTIVCKPPHQNPLSSLILSKVYEALPPGVLNIVTGDGSTGEALINHPDVDLIAFTGSTKVGRDIAATAGRHLKKVNLELGGIDPFIVFPDADIDIAVRGVAWARLLNAGQVCTSSKRIYLVKDIAETFTQKILAYVQTLKVGDPMKADTDIGPLINEDALLMIEKQIAKCVEEGAKILLGGKRFQPDGLKGYYFQPTILTNVKHGSLPTTEEIFGPVISLITTSSSDEAITMANDSKYGLGACVYTKSLELAMKAMENIKAGTFWVNDPLTDNNAGPFGGMRASGIGRELGPEGLDAFREPKHVHIDYVMEAKDYWFPYKNRNK